MANFPPKLKNYLVEAIVETLGYVDPNRQFRPMSPPQDDGALLRLPLTSVIEFEGERVKGALTLACSAEFLRLTNPVKQIPRGKEDHYQRDWLGEIVNLILGTLKRKMANHDLLFKIGTPFFGHYSATTVMVLERFGEAGYGESGLLGDFWFDCNKHPCCFQLGLSTAESFR